MKKEVVKGFKGFEKDLKCRDFQYEIGKTYKIDGDISLCSRGFHFCKKLWDVHNFYEFNNENYRYCEIEALGNVIDDADGKKSVTNIIKIVREIPREEFIESVNIGEKNTGYCNTGYSNTGDRNTGYWNTGDRNTGDCNTGDRNTGDCNTGDRNTGYWNTGDRNTGDWNTGDRNTGDRNTGDCNTGDSNTGDWNTGDWNTGYSNTGDRNTGYWNTGDRNTGDWNTGDRNTGDWNKTNRCNGVFCNQQPKLIMFNKETDMSFEEWKNTRAYDVLNMIEKSEWVYFNDMSNEEKKQYPSAENCGGYLKEIPRKEAVKEWWDNLDNYDKQEIFNLPNFNLDIFNDIMESEITQEEYNEVMKNVNR